MTEPASAIKESKSTLPATKTTGGGLAPSSLVRSIQNSRAGKLLKRLPGSDLAQSQLERLEGRVLSELKQRLNNIEQQSSSDGTSSLTPIGSQASLNRPGDHLRNLLERAVDQSREQAENEFFNHLLNQLVPDEARILAALADGSSYPVINVTTSSRLGLGNHLAVEYVCSIGKKCGIKAQLLAIDYIRHLVQLGLVTVVNELAGDQTAYQMLESESVIRTTMDAAKAKGQRAQMVKRALKMSTSGERFWEACRLSMDEE